VDFSASRIDSLHYPNRIDAAGTRLDTDEFFFLLAIATAGVRIIIVGRDNRTAIEPFSAGIRDWDAGLRRQLDDRNTCPD
jgi:hypothetical protein